MGASFPSRMQVKSFIKCHSPPPTLKNTGKCINQATPPPYTHNKQRPKKQNKKHNGNGIFTWILVQSDVYTSSFKKPAPYSTLEIRSRKIAKTLLTDYLHSKPHSPVTLQMGHSNQNDVNRSSPREIIIMF